MVREVDRGQEKLQGGQGGLLSPTGCPWQAGGIHPQERKWEKGWSRTQREKEMGGEGPVLRKKK